MKIIYHCYGGTHSSVTAAFIHLDLLPADCIPGRKIFYRIPFYDRQESSEHGHIFFAGVDRMGNEIYVAAQRGRPEVLINIFQGLAEIFDIPPQEYLLINITPEVNPVMRLGGYLSRRLGLIKLGRPIVIMGTRASYFRLVSLVKKVKHELGECEFDHPVFQRHQVSPGCSGRRNSYRPDIRTGKNQSKCIMEYYKLKKGR